MMKHDTDPRRDLYGRALVPLPTAAQAAAADAAARERHGVPERVLMENAGRAAALVLQRLYPEGPVLGVAGSGNNGGDLLVMLRVLRAWGREVSVVAAGGQAPPAVLAHGEDVPVTGSDEEGAAGLGRAAVLVDGLLGTGSSGPPRGRAAEWITRLNSAGRPVVALDMPSGVDPTTGAVPAEAVHAAVTVTFGWPKLGLMLQPARQHCGRLVAVEIGFPAGSVEAGARAITPAMVQQLLRPREPAAHKSSVGRLLVLAGSSGMAGAAVLAVGAAYRAGAGLVRVASSADNRVILQGAAPEATFLDRAAVGAADVESMHGVVAGPGMGTDASAVDALLRTLQLTGSCPVLLDADALNILAGREGSLEQLAAGRPVLVTPHPRELARLTGGALADILADPPAAARGAARRFGVAVLLKGQPSIVATPDGTLLVNTTGSSDLATAGMGDQLSGTIGALLAAGLTAAEAAAAGLFLAGRAADLCGLGPSLVPHDVSTHLAWARREPGLPASPLDLPFVTFDQPPRW